MNPSDSIISHVWLGSLSEFLRDRLGLHIPENQWPDLHRNFTKASEAFGYSNPADCFQWLTQAELPAKKLYKLAGFLTVGETYFFREKNHFEPMARQLFGEIINRKRHAQHKQLRIWSAACSTGEEPYSIAMLLDAMLPDIDEWSIRILATDINPLFLERARTAVYRPWSFRGTPEWVRQRYFRTENDNHIVLPEIQQRVTFDFLNLAEDVYPALSTQTQAMDVIFCRNVLIYFASEQARKTIHRLRHALVEGGWLILSPTETVYVDDPALQREHVKDAILYRKNSSGSVAQRRPATEKPPGLSRRFSQREPAAYIRQQPKICPVQLPSVAAPAPPAAKIRTKTAKPLSVIEKAEALYIEGRHQETAELIRTHLRGRAPRNREAFLLARAQANLGELDEALDHALNAVETDKLCPEYHYLLAMIQLEKDAQEEAGRSLRRVVYLDERHLMALFSLGHLALRQQKFKTAKKYFENTLQLLQSFNDDVLLQEGEGITAGRLRELIRAGLPAE